MLAFIFILLILSLFVCPVSADGALPPEELVDTLFSTDSERYMKSHYIIADNMIQLTDVQIASTIYKEIDGVKSAAADIWNFITGNTDDYLEMAVVELLLGEFTTGDGTQKAKESRIKGLLDFMNILDTAWQIEHPTPDYKIVSETAREIIVQLGRGQEIDDALIDDVFKKVGDLDKTFFDRTKDVFTAANCVSAVFNSVEIVNNSRVELTNLFQAAAMLSTLETEYQAIISKLRSNASKAGRKDLVEAIDAVEALALSDGKWSYAEFKEYGEEVLRDATEFFFKVLVDNLGAKWVLNITGQKLAQTYFSSAAFAYKAGTFVCNAVFDSSAVARVYAQLEALSELEQSGAEVLKDVRDTLLSSPTYENAKLFHTAMRMQQQIEIDAVDLFIELCRIFNDNGFKKLFGDTDYEEYIKEYQEIRANLVAKECCGYFDRRAENKCKENLKYSISGGEVTITGCKNKDFTTIRIPDTIDGYPVTKISSKAFYEHTKLTGIELPRIRKIDDFAFYGCTDLKNINLPSTLEEIGKSVLACTAISNVIIPNRITTIPDSAFSRCKSLEKITMPDSLISIERCAFMESSVTSAVIPEGVTVIEECAFQNCKSLYEIELPQSLIEIGSCAFLGTNLTTVRLPSMLKSIGDNTFSECHLLRNINLPQSLEYIGGYAFYETGLENVVISDGIKVIEEGTFCKCYSLKNVVIPRSVEEIMEAAFFCCESLETIELPEGLKTLGQYVFYGCIKLDHVTIPDSVIFVGDSLFACCESLENVKLPAGITSINYRMFAECISLKRIVIPDDVETIGYASFYKCSDLMEIVMPDSIMTFEGYAFSKCTSLEYLDMPTELSVIEEAVFFDCPNLKAIDLPEGLVHIGEYAFEACESLEIIAIPQGVTAISAYTFFNCRNLKTAFIYGNIYVIGEDAFRIGEEDPSKTNLEYVYASTGDYVSKYFAENYPSVYVISPEEPALVLPASLKELKDEAMASSGVTTVKLPQGMESIGARAFADCTYLTQITIPSSVTYIEGNAFDGCTDRLVFFAEPGSIAVDFAKAHDIICIEKTE